MKLAYTYLLWLLPLIVAGCYKDKGNYDYKITNKVVVKDTIAAKRVEVNKGDMLKLTPEITQTIRQGNENLTYEWTMFPLSGGSTLRRSISKEKQLNIKLDTAFILGYTYNVTVKVTDQISGESSFLSYTIGVGNKFSSGWILLEDKNGSTDFSMILPSGEVVHNVYSFLNGAPIADKPVRVQMSQHSVDDGSALFARKMYLLMQNSAMELDYTTITRTRDFKALFYTPPSVTRPGYINWPNSTTGLGVIINDGKLNVNIAGGFPGIKKWGSVLLSPENSMNYDLSSNISTGNSIAANTYNLVVFDKIKKRFINTKGTATSLDSFHTKASTVFDLNNTGMDLLQMDNGLNGVANAFMKDAAGQPWFCRFRMNFAVTDSSVTMMKNLMSNADAVNMTSAASSWVSDHMFYSVGNKIYRYEPVSNTIKLQYEFPADETISFVRCPVPLADMPSLAAITWNGSESKLYNFYLSLTGEISAYSASYGGFGKVIDAQYKFR